MPHNRPENHEVYFEIYTKYSGVYDKEQKKKYQVCLRSVLKLTQDIWVNLKNVN